MDAEIRPLTRQDLEAAPRSRLVEYLDAHGYVGIDRYSVDTLRAVALSEFDITSEVET